VEGGFIRGGVAQRIAPENQEPVPRGEESEALTEGKKLRCGVPGGGADPRLQKHRTSQRGPSREA